MAWKKTEPAAGIKARVLDDLIRDNNAALETALDNEHDFATGGTQTGRHTQGSARCFFQDAAPSTRIDGTSFTAVDYGSIWVDSNSDPDNQFNILTNHDPVTWTPISTEIIAVMVAAIHTWAALQTFSVIPALPASDPTTDNQAVRKAYADAIAASEAATAEANANGYTDTEIAAAVPDDDAFGDWASKSNNTVYQAASDGFVCAYASTDSYVQGYTDSSNPPTTKRAGGGTGDWHTRTGSVMMPVKKSDYWKVTGATNVFWLPIGA